MNAETILWLGALFIAMLAGHYVADRILQPGYLANGKRLDDVMERWRALVLHGVAHGFFVSVITSSPILAIAEVVTHAAIDRGKCRGHYGMKTDQSLHVMCKLVWLAALALGAP